MVFLIICLALLILPFVLIFVRRYLAQKRMRETEKIHINGAIVDIWERMVSSGRGQSTKHYVLSILDEDGVRRQSEGHHERSHLGIQIARGKLTKGTRGLVALRVDKKGKQTYSGFLPGLDSPVEEEKIEE